MPRYEGTYSPLREHPFCSACETEDENNVKQATTAAVLKRCSRCKMVWYCSVACQKRDYGHHKHKCRDIKNLQTQLDAYEPFFEANEEGRPTAPLDSDRLPSREAMSYVETRTNLCLEQWSVANQVQTRDAWTVVLDHHLDLLTLWRSASVILQMNTPFMMLRLNRDDSAYCFCRHALKMDWTESDLNFTTGTVRSNLNYCIRDVMEDFGGDHGLNRCPDVAYVVALAVIKMRLVAMYESLLEEVDAFAATRASHILGPDGQVDVRQFLVGRAEDERILADQRRQLIVLLDVAQARNASMVPALLDPKPLMRVPVPSEFPPGTPAEARMVLDFALPLWKDIPGSDRFLQNRFGTATPAYPT